MRCRKDDRLQSGMPDGFLVAAIVREAVGFGELLAARIGLRGADDLDIALGLLEHGGHLLAPPAETDHRDFDGSGHAHLNRSPSRCRLRPAAPHPSWNWQDHWMRRPP